jgi:RNA polymerase sigma-70 factor (ECF subfamily)
MSAANVPATPTLDQLFAAFIDTGCEASLQQLLRRSAPELRRLARRLGASADDADDLVQETVIAAIEVADRWDRSRPLLPWLRGILTFRRAHLARAQVRRRTTADQRGAQPADELPGSGPDAAAAAEQQELTASVREAIADLPPHYQKALRLYLLEQHTPRQIADGLQQPRATVRVHLHRGLQQLRLALQRWSAPVLAWLWMRPGSAASGAALRRTIAIAVPLSLVVVWWLVARSAAGAAPDGAPSSAPMAAVPGPVAAAVRAPTPSVDDRRIVAPSPATAPTVTVIACDGDGRPVPAVGITCTRIDGVDPRLHRRRAVTDDRGAVHWSLAPRGHYVLQVDRGPRLEIPRLERTVTYRVLLREPAELRGRALGPDGAPIAGASVWLGSEPGDALSGQDVAHTAADGTFSLRHVPDAAQVAVRHPDWCSSEVVSWQAGNPQPLELRLGAPAGAIALLLVDANGQPVAAAEAWAGDAMDALPLHLADGAIARRPPPNHGRSDGDGRVVLAGLPAGPLPLLVRAAGFAPMLTTVEVVARAELQHRLALQPQAPVTGRVVDDRGRAIAAAMVVCRSESLGGDIDAVTAADGSFVFESPPAPPFELAARAPGHEPRVLSVDAATTGPMELRLPSGRVRTGTVLGLPPASGPVMLRAQFPPTALQPEPMVVPLAADGEFVLTGGPAERPQLALRLPGEPLWRELEVLTRWHGDRAVVQLPADFGGSAFLQGVLRTQAGAPLAAARLFVHADGRRWAELGSTAADGSFRLGPLPPGRYGLHAETTRPELPSWWLGEHELAAGARCELAAVAPAAGALQLDLGAEDGGDPGPMVLTIVDVARQRRAALPSSPQSRQTLLPGRYRVFAMCDRLRWIDGAPVQIEAGAVTTLRLRLPRANHVTLVVRGLPGPHAAPRQFTIHDLDRGETCGQFSPPIDAAMRLQAVLPSGRYELRHTADDGREWRALFAVDSTAAPSVHVLQMLP